MLYLFVLYFYSVSEFEATIQDKLDCNKYFEHYLSFVTNYFAWSEIF